MEFNAEDKLDDNKSRPCHWLLYEVTASGQGWSLDKGAKESYYCCTNNMKYS